MKRVLEKFNVLRREAVWTIAPQLNGISASFDSRCREECEKVSSALQHVQLHAPVPLHLVTVGLPRVAQLKFWTLASLVPVLALLTPSLPSLTEFLLSFFASSASLCALRLFYSV
jgi:hypothetical protein